MLVYGDRQRREAGAAVVEAVRAALRRAAACGPGTGRHGELVGAFVLAGELLQGVADRERDERGLDAPSPAQDACTALLCALARAVLASWEGGLAALPPPDVLGPVEALDLTRELAIRQPEGYAFYALYPESYGEAARRLGIEGPVRVVGIRSIGTGLAAIAAAALGAPPPLTVRPGGHPFSREIAVSDGWSARALDEPRATYVVADEGPGLSGSSFGAVADWLEARGVARERIAFLPSHPGDLGPRASPEHRARWRAARRACVPFEEVAGLGAPPGRGILDWMREAAGSPAAAVREISGGAWRGLRYADEALWPGCDVAQERLKFLAEGPGGAVVARFAGLGEIGARKLALARELHREGFVPEPLGLCHGFLVERWIDAAPPGLAGLDRAALVERLAAYIGFRARRFPAAPDEGASPEALLAMARHNAREALGEEAGLLMGGFEALLPGASASWRPVAGDNRMHLREWLAMPDGRLLKADALDHHAGHDLVGCQDPAWDVAGAEIELGLDAAETEELAGRVEAGGAEGTAGKLVLARPCYAAFQLGACRMAALALDWPEERGRLAAEEARYAGALRRAIARTTS